MGWLSKMLKDSKGDPSTKRVLFALVVLFALGWLTTVLAMAHWVITSEWTSVFYALLGGVCGSYVGGVALGEKTTSTDK